ncbi:carboxymuconolactone decarboxylase family protein [Flavobacteriaceae bacterium]|jgi:uncharacterized peroxidase-related enzyme|nr:carboxymuconolactone decarboxylase family protein [Flavobacteriaceae bacterium]
MNSYKMKMSLVNLSGANDKQKDLLMRTKKENRMIPNMYQAMVNSPGLLDSYMHGYKKFRIESGFTSTEQEVVLLTISAENSCSYCMAAHSMLADTVSKVPLEVTESIRNHTKISDDKLRGLSGFVSTMVNKRGLPDENEVQAFLNLGYTEGNILDVILAISVKTISNYTNHVFKTELDTVFKTREWSGYKVSRSIFNFFRSLV